MNSMKLESEIERIVIDTVEELKRPDLFRRPFAGFSSAEDKRYTDLKTLIGDWHQTPAELLPGAVSVISYCVPFTKEVVSEPKTVQGGSPLWAEAYQEINKQFDVINENIARFLEGAGYSAKTIRATHTYDPRDMKAMWSHRSAAAIAGLGSFGANRLLITKKGSGVRFCTVITTAPLEANTKTFESKCLYLKNGSCGLCFRICPVKALEPDSMDKFSCQDELNRNGARLREATELQNTDTCGKCISICPVAYIE
ncbi:(Fe-S)-binding protein [Bacillota bacterium]